MGASRREVRADACRGRVTPVVSVVIPCRHDAAALGRTLDHLCSLPKSPTVEIIVAASGQQIETDSVCRDRVTLIWPEGSTRAELMNAGAAVATGDLLFSLHADSLPPVDWLSRIHAAAAVPDVVGGAFEHRFAEPVYSLRIISWMNRRRYRLTRNYYGDQGLFVRADVFRRLGGFPSVRLMEDLIFSQRLKRAGRTVVLPAPLVTSGRRFLANGPWRTLVSIAWLLALHTCRLDTERYAEWWRGAGATESSSTSRSRA
jgi:rSAM/selenodomain-associated transferase 2